MANYYCSSRTNYFRVKDVTRFTAWATKLGLAIHPSENLPGQFTLFPRDSDSGAFPNAEAESDDEIDFAAELAAHLHQDSVAVILETGAEKLRYLQGHAIAINASGETVEVSLDAIYALALRRFPGKEVTRAEY